MSVDHEALTFLPPSGQVTRAAAWSVFDGLIRKSVLAMLTSLAHGSISLIDGDERFAFGWKGDVPSVVVTVRDKAAYRAILFGGSVGAGEAYVKGMWGCDDLPALARILARNMDTLDAMDGSAAQLARRAGELFTGVGRRNTRAGSRRNIANHYDLSNEFFQLFLDQSMTYSSGLFEREDASLDEAQLAKLDRICEKLRLGHDDHLLELGTGWGALAIHAARHYGCRVTTTTISRKQYEFASQRVRDEGLEGKVEVLLRDYRDIEGQYDKLVSVEMIEAVGHRYLDDFFRVCGERLAPDGLVLLQAITIADQHHEKHRTSIDFIKEYVFPGSCLPSVTSMVTSATCSTDLRLADLEDMTSSYVRTLRIWRERFLGRLDEVRGLGFDEEFIRTWDYYLAYCEGGFEERYLGCVQGLFTKPDSRPTRVGRRLGVGVGAATSTQGDSE